MSTYNTVIKKRNPQNNGWDSILPITTAENVLVDESGKTVKEFIDGVPGRNYLINGNFDVWQRGTSFNIESPKYTADRWHFDGVVNGSVSRICLAPNELVGSLYALRFKGGTTPIYFRQRIEKFVRISAGLDITLSFYARASIDSVTISNIYARQNFGTGGNVSPIVSTPFDSSSIVVGTDLKKYEIHVTLPSILGKSMGSDENDFLEIFFNPQNIDGVTLDFAQIKLEIGNVATDFISKTFNEVLEECLYYYEKSYGRVKVQGDITTIGAHRTSAESTYYLSQGMVKMHSKRIVPSIGINSISTGQIGKMYDVTAELDKSATLVYTSENSFLVYCQDNDLVEGNEIMFQWVADAEIY